MTALTPTLGDKCKLSAVVLLGVMMVPVLLVIFPLFVLSASQIMLRIVVTWIRWLRMGERAV